MAIATPATHQHHPPLPPPLTRSMRVAWLSHSRSNRPYTIRALRRQPSTVHVAAQQGDGSGDSDGKFVDTRIHWTSPNDGWIGVPGSSAGSVAAPPPPPPPPQARYGRDQGSGEAGNQGRVEWGNESDSGSDTEVLRRAVGKDLLLRMAAEGSDNHYTFLGVSPLADLESVKSAYRRLSKLYHPDTTDLPLPVAAQRFMQLQAAYEVLSSADTRRLYDWQIARNASLQQGGRFVWPYEVDGSQRGAGSRPPSFSARPGGGPGGTGGRTGGAGGGDDGSKPLSDASITALAFDALALLVAAMAITYALVFKQAPLQ